MSECRFCYLYNLSKELSKGLSFKTKYCASMVEISIVNGKQRGRTTHRARPLRYCPECGKKLGGNKRG